MRLMGPTPRSTPRMGQTKIPAHPRRPHRGQRLRATLELAAPQWVPAQQLQRVVSRPLMHGEASTLVAADHQATVAPPIWKLCASGTWHSCTLHKHARHRLTPSGWTSSWTHTDGRCYNIFFPGVMSIHACSSDLPPSGGTEGVVPYPIGGPGRHDYVSIKVCHSLDSMPFPTAPRAPRARSDQQPIILSQVARSRLPSSPLPAPPPPPLLSLTGWEGVPHQVCTHAYTGTHSYACICAYVCICTYMCRCVCMCASQPGAAVLTMSHRHPPPSPTPTPSP